MKISLKNKILVSFLFSIALIVGFGLLYFDTNDKLNKSINRYQHTQKAISEMNALFSFLLEAESSQRGYLLTRQQNYIEACNLALNKMYEKLEQLKLHYQLTGGKNKKSLDNLEKSINERVAVFKTNISLTKNDEIQKAIEHIFSGKGRTLMEIIHQDISELEHEEIKNLSYNDSEIEKQSMKSRQFIFITLIFSVLIVLTGMSRIIKELNKKNKLGAELHDKNEELKFANEKLKLSNQLIINLSESALKQSDALFKITVDNLPNPLIIFSINEEIEFMNVAAINILEIENQKLEGKKGQEILKGLNQSTFFDLMSQAIKTKTPIKQEIETIEKGKKYFFICHFVPLIMTSKGLVKILSFLFDVSEARQFQGILEQKVKARTADLYRLNKALKKNVEQITDLYHNAPCGYQSVNNKGRIINMNFTALHWLGYSFKELENKPFLNILTKSSKIRYKEILPDFIKTKNIKDMELDLLKNDGNTLPVLINATANLDDNGNFMNSRMTFLDNTELIIARQDIAKRTIALEAANKELESFSYSVSHDLRAPLRSVIGFSRILRDEYGKKLDQEGIRLLNIISESALKMGKLIDDLLEFSKLGRKGINEMKFEMGELLLPLIREIKNDLAPEKDIEIIVQDLPAVNADPQLIKQVWINLVSNAIKFSSKAINPKIEIGFEQTEEEIIFYITDNGAGFDMEYADKLFGVFQRLHSSEEFEGTGVGLAIVYRIVSAHEGRVWAVGDKDKGATFYFTLPQK